MAAKRLTPMRKVSCPDCGYTIRMARGWMQVGMPSCPCGAEMTPEAPADLAFLGIIGPEDMTGAAWTAICRENGWEDAILRKGAAAKAWEQRRRVEGARRTSRAEHCAHHGCGKWIPAGATHCQTHAEREAMAF